MARAESITTSFSRDTIQLCPGTVRWTFCCLAYLFFFLLFHFVWVYFVCLFSLEVVVKHPEIAFMLLCFHVSFSKAQKICQRFATSTAWSEPVTWHGRILYPITQSYSHYMQLSLFSCIYTANIFIGKTVELTDH